MAGNTQPSHDEPEKDGGVVCGLVRAQWVTGPATEGGALRSADVRRKGKMPQKQKKMNLHRKTTRILAANILSFVPNIMTENGANAQESNI